MWRRWCTRAAGLWRAAGWQEARETRDAVAGLDRDARDVSAVWLCGQSGGVSGGWRREALTVTPLVRQDGATPLLIASQEGHVEVVGTQLAKGGDVEAKTNVRTS